MHVLFLDDSDDRKDCIAKQCPPGIQITFVSTATACIERLQNVSHWDLVCLDHDLGLAHETGFTVVDFLRTLDESQVPHAVLIHSWNIGRAEMMENVLNRHTAIEKVWRRPFDENNIITHITQLLRTNRIEIDLCSDMCVES